MTPVMAPRVAGLASIIIPVYNRPRLLVDAVESALAQTYRPLEIVIIDDGSTDHTTEVARGYAERRPEIVRCVRVEHGRDWRARNIALTMATGEFVQFLDSDDLIAPDKLAVQIAALHDHPDCALSYSYVREYAIGDPPPARPARRTGQTIERLFPHLLSGRVWGSPSPLFRRSLLDRIGPFLELSANPDWEAECRMAALDVRVHHCRRFLGDIRNTHRLEGRRRPIATSATMRESVVVHERILGHARAAKVAARELHSFAVRLFVVGRESASIGLEDEAQRMVRHAYAIASPWRRRAIGLFIAGAGAVGWQRAGAVCEHLASARNLAMDPARRALRLWRHRAALVANDVLKQPVSSWPSRLTRLWLERPSRRAVGERAAS